MDKPNNPMGRAKKNGNGLEQGRSHETSERRPGDAAEAGAAGAGEAPAAAGARAAKDMLAMAIPELACNLGRGSGARLVEDAVPAQDRLRHEGGPAES